MKKKRINYKLLTFIVVIFIPIISFAHKGRTDSYGGHYNRSTGTYHYHSGKHAGTGEYTAPIEEGGELIDSDAYYTNTNGKHSSSTILVTNTIINTSTNASSSTKSNAVNKETSSKNRLSYPVKVLITIFIIGFVGEYIIDLFPNKEISSTGELNTNILSNDNSKPSTYFSKTTYNKYKCPSCGGQLQLKTGKYGKFIGCKNYPYCKYTKSIKYR